MIKNQLAVAPENKTNAPQKPVSAIRAGRRIQSRTAMALVGTMLVLMLILAVGLVGVAKSGQSSGDIGNTSNSMLQMAKLRIRSQKAETVADAGFRASIQWISELSGPPVNAAAFTPREVTPTEFYAGSGPVDSGKWTVVNFPVADDATQGQFKVRFYPHKDNAVAAERQYLVESVGIVEGTVRVVRADIKQKNFAQYAYFTDDLGTGGFVGGRTTFGGPVHINNSNGADMTTVWDTSLTNPEDARIFRWDGDNAFTMWNRGGANSTKMKWYKDSTGAGINPPTSSTDWKRIITPSKDPNTGIETARTGPKMVDDRIKMPETSYDQRDAALGGTTESVLIGKPEGVYVPSTLGPDASSGTPVGGVYITGQVNDMVMEAAGTGNRDQIIHVYQDNRNSKYTLRMNTNGTTTVNRFRFNSTTKLYVPDANNGYPKSFSGAATNGVIYSREDIGQWSPGNGTGGLSGTVANSQTDGLGNVTQSNKLTICTRIEGSPTSGTQKTINIDGNILYANSTTATAAAPTDAGTLGLVAGYIKIVPNALVVESKVTGFEVKDANGVPVVDNTDPDKIKRRDGYNNEGAALANLSVHGTIMSYNTIKIDSYDSRAKGRFQLLGGYIAQVGSPFGTGVGGSGANRFDVVTGFDRVLNYDKRVANQPPPYFPGTSQAYEIVSYQRILAPLYP